VPERCSPPAAPFPPRPPQEVSLPCSVGSQVLRRSPTSPTRAYPSCGYNAFPDRPSETAEGTLEISRFSCMLSPSACAGSNDYAGPDSHSRYRNCRIAFLLLARESAS
jgi:hypothetical protein